MNIKVIIRRKRLFGILLPLVIALSLATVGTVFADDGTAPQAAAEETADSGQGEETFSGTTAESGEESSAPEAADEATSDEQSDEDEEGSDTGGDTSTEDTQDAEEEGEEASDESSGETDAADSEEDEEQSSADEVDSEDEDSEEEEQASADEATTEEEGSEDEEQSSADEAASEEETDTETEEDQDVTVVDENGEEIDLESEESQETLSNADPYWYVGSTKYAVVKTGGTCPADADYCFESDTPITTALQYIDDNNVVPSNGLLYVEADSYTEDVTVDGSSGNGYLSSLKGIISTGSSSDTIITGTVSISNTTSGFTLSGFTIIGSLSMSDNSGTITLEDVTVESSSGAGISVTNHNGNVVVEQTASNNNATYGLYVDNTAGTGSVTISNSEFSVNLGGDGYAGLYVDTNGKITLDVVSASGNTASGAILLAAKGTTITASVFSANSIYGIYIDTTSTKNSVTISEVTIATNGYDGLYLFTGGSVKLADVTVYNNGHTSGDNGAYIDTTAGSKATVTVTDSSFNSNDLDGLYIKTLGSVTISGITVEGNTRGLTIHNDDGSGNVTISGKQLNSINNNSLIGLQIYSNGNVYLSYFEAENNGYGVIIQNNYEGSSGSVTIALAYKSDLEEFTNSVSNNTSGGLIIYSNGNIAISNLIATGNSEYGISLNNSFAAKARTVKLSNVDSYENTEDGILITSIGSVTLYMVNAYSNDLSGLEIDTSGGTGTIKIYAGKNSTLDFSGNGAYGIYIMSAGKITLSAIDASGNCLWFVY